MLRVLVVEDEDDLREAIESSLQSWYLVVSVRDGRAALDLLARERVDVIVLDLMMPRMSGDDFMAQYAIRQQAVPVIIMSSAIVRRERWQRLGGAEFLQKPFFIAELVECLGRVTGGGRGGGPFSDSDGTPPPPAGPGHSGTVHSQPFAAG